MTKCWILQLIDEFFKDYAKLLDLYAMSVISSLNYSAIDIYALIFNFLSKNVLKF